MKSQKNITAFIIFMILLISIFILLKYYSGQISLGRDGYYEIVSQIKGNFEKIEGIKNKLTTEIETQVVMENVSPNLYRLHFGKFSDSYDAGEKAFNLFADSLIQNYKIALDGKDVPDTFTNILFAARNEERASLFSLNLLTKRTSLIWSDWGEEVVSFEHSEKNKSSFFLTVSSAGKKNGMNYLNDARLYHYNRRTDKIRMIEFLKNGFQFFSYWNAANQYMVSFTYLDSLSNQGVFQDFSVYDTSGVRMKNFQKKFNLAKEGYPIPPQKKLNFTSTMNRYVLVVKKNEKGENAFYIKKNYSNQEYLVASAYGEISDIAWSNDEKYLFIIYSGIKNISKKVKKNEYFCTVFDTDSKKPTCILKDQDFKKLSVIGRLLSVETGTGPDSKIMFYDYIKEKIYFILDVKGGCSIKNLPLLK